MIPAILGKKVGMTQVYNDKGQAVAATVVEAGPCTILAIRQAEADGYDAVQLGFDDAKVSRASRAMIGHCAKAGSTPKRYIREFRIAAEGVSVGDTITVELFESSETKYVDITGVTKGRGFMGVMRRHGFGGQPDSHGTERKHRSPGAISSFAAQRGASGGLRRGKKMAGHMGAVRRTVRNQKLIGVVKEQNLLVVSGVVPGANGSYVMVRASKTKK